MGGETAHIEGAWTAMGTGACRTSCTSMARRKMMLFDIDQLSRRNFAVPLQLRSTPGSLFKADKNEIRTIGSGQQNA